MSCQYNNQVIILLIQAFEHQNWGTNAQLASAITPMGRPAKLVNCRRRSGGVSAAQKLTRANTCLLTHRPAIRSASSMTKSLQPKNTIVTNPFLWVKMREDWTHSQDLKT